MDGIRSVAAFIISVIIVFIGLHNVSGETLNRVVAIVNDDVITLHELNKKIKEVTGLTSEDLRFQDENTYLEMRRKILDLLIDDKITQEKIRELGIRITPKQIDGAIEKIKRDNQWTHEDLLARLKREAIDYERYRENIKKDLELIRLINFEVKSKIIIREDQICEYYQKHKEGFCRDGNVHLASIFLIQKDPGDEEEFRELSRKGEEILARLRKGEDFGKLASSFSNGPGAVSGGDLGIFKTSQLEPKLKELLEGMPNGGCSDLIIRPNGIQIIKLIERQDAEVKSLEEARDAIYAILYQEEVNSNYVSWIEELRKNSYTKIIF